MIGNDRSIKNHKTLIIKSQNLSQMLRLEIDCCF